MRSVLPLAPLENAPFEFGRRLRGYRIFLRHLAISDQAEFLRLVRESRRAHLPWVSPPMAAAGFQRLVRRAEARTVISLLACERRTKSILGVFNLTRMFRAHFRDAYLGYYGHIAFAGQGFMREGLELVVRYAFGDLGFQRIEADIQPANLRSIALVRRCGFAKEEEALRYLKVAGRVRDHERWVITAVARARST
jgi:ribosomal-protein-alanine N-acetyltransferase